MRRWNIDPRPSEEYFAFFAICIIIYLVKNAIQSKKKIQKTMMVNHSPEGPVYDGYEQFTHKLKGNKTADVHISIQSVSGSLNVKVTRIDACAEELFDERKIKSRLCNIPITAPGTYKIVITANHFCGSYDVRWE